MAKELVMANLVGYDSHGVIRIPQYLDQMKMGKIVPGAKIEVVKETPTTAIVDGHLKFGQMVGYAMADIVMEKAKKNGMGCAVSLNAAHAGRVGSYTEYIAGKGFSPSARSASAMTNRWRPGVQKSRGWAQTRSPGPCRGREASPSSWTDP